MPDNHAVPVPPAIVNELGNLTGKSGRVLIVALVAYLVDSTDKAAVRDAIAIWIADVENVGLRPEKVLEDFKAMLHGLDTSKRNFTFVEQLRERRELVLMVIEEFFRDGKFKR